MASFALSFNFNLLRALLMPHVNIERTNIYIHRLTVKFKDHQLVFNFVKLAYILHYLTTDHLTSQLPD